MKSANLGIFQGPNNDQDCTGSGFSRLRYLERVHHEVFPQTRDHRRTPIEIGNNLAKIIERAAEEFIVREHRKTVCTRGLIA